MSALGVTNRDRFDLFCSFYLLLKNLSKRFPGILDSISLFHIDLIKSGIETAMPDGSGSCVQDAG